MMLTYANHASSAESSGCHLRGYLFYPGRAADFPSQFLPASRTLTASLKMLLCDVCKAGLEGMHDPSRTAWIRELHQDNSDPDSGAWQSSPPRDARSVETRPDPLLLTSYWLTKAEKSLDTKGAIMTFPRTCTAITRMRRH